MPLEWGYINGPTALNLWATVAPILASNVSRLTDNLAYAAGFDCFVNAPAGTVRLLFCHLVHRVAVLEIYVGPSELGF